MNSFARVRRITIAVTLIALLPLAAAAQKPQAAVTGAWIGAPDSAQQLTDLDLVLHVSATEDAYLVAVDIIASEGVEVVGGSTHWNGSLDQGKIMDIPVKARIVADGDWTLGARVTNYRGGVTQVSGAALNVVAANGIARLGTDPHFLLRLSDPLTADFAALGVAAPDPGPSRIPDVSALASAVSGTVRYSTPEGTLLPVRFALVQITDGTSGALLAQTGTNAAGVYTANINADSIRVTAFTQDVDNIRAAVFPPGQATQRYILQSAVTPVTAATTTINLTSEATVRGTPGAPSTDSISARAFITYDGMLTFWAQTTALIGRNMQQALVNFPVGGAVSFYSPSTQQMSILREDALDWDVLGHEFFHFTTHRAAARNIDQNPGGPHSGGSAIGQNGRSRDEGMRLAWAEGLATYMSLQIQVAPIAAFPFPGLLNVGDAMYQDLEDQTLITNPETPLPSDGFGSENSVLGLLWDLSDAAADADGTVQDSLAVLNASLLWNLINFVLPCNPCNRVDRFWTSIPVTFGITSPLALEAAKLFVLNKIAPKATAPPDNQSVGGTSAPTFVWDRNGDPSAGHRNNQFYLVFSRDNFQSHLILIPVPTVDATSYQPTDAEWASVQAGGTVGQPYKWFVAAQRSDAPTIPEGWFWYSNVMTVVPRSLEAIIQWVPLGSDVDLHLANPSGTDIAYYNTTTSWGFLDRDCITTCTQEIISVNSLPLSGQYRLFVHYYSDHDLGPATVRAIVRAGSAILLDTVFVLSGTGAVQNLVTVNIADERITATVDPGADTVDPAALPRKPQ